MNSDLENHLEARSFRLAQWSTIILFLRTTSRGSTNLVRKFYLECSSDMHLYAGKKLERRYFGPQTLRSWRTWKRQKNPSSKAQCKGVVTPRNGENSLFPVAGKTAKLSGRDHEVREPTPRRDRPVRSEDLRRELQGEQEGCQPTETKDDAESRRDFWSRQGEFMCRHHIEPRVQLYVPQEETFPVPLKYMDVTRASYINLDVLQE